MTHFFENPERYQMPIRVGLQLILIGISIGIIIGSKITVAYYRRHKR